MAKLPDYRSQRSLNTGSAPLVSSDKTGLRQAAAMGNALQNAGQNLQALAQHNEKRERQKEDFATAQNYQQMHIELGADQDSFFEQAPADGSGFTDKFMTEGFQKRRDVFFDGLPERQREKYSQVLETDRLKWATSAAKIERKQLYESSAQVIAEQQNTFMNQISLDAGTYAESVASGMAIIDAAPIPEAMKDQARQDWEASALAALAGKMIDDDPEAAKKALGGGSEAQGAASKRAADLLREFEGFRTGTYYDVDAHRTGYGSDTITKADGTIQKVRKGDKVSRADAERDLARRTAEFENKTIKQVGGKQWAALPANARAALISTTYNYGTLPDKVANAVKTGDVEAIAQAVEGLKGHNKGINSDRRQKEANIIRGAEGITGAGKIDPTFAGMDYDARQRALNLANNGIRQRKSGEISDNAEMKGAFQLQIATDDPSLTFQDILSSPLKDSDKAQLVTSLESARKAQRSAMEYALRLQSGGDFDPYSTDDRKGIDTFFDGTTDGVSVLDDQNAQTLARDIYSRSGILPKSALNQIRRGLGSIDPQQAASAAALASALQSDRPNEPGLLGARDGGSELEKAATSYKHLTDNLGYSAEEAGRHLAEMNDPQKRREREALLDTESAKDAIKEINAGTLAAALDPQFLGMDPQFRDPNIEAFAVSEYRQMFKDNIVALAGDMDAAKSLTDQQIAKRYGVSDYTVAGNEKIVRFPVEKAFGSVNGNHDWIGEQVLEALIADGFTRDYHPLTGEASEKSINPDKIYLEPSIETEMDIRAGRPPRYLLKYDVAGKVQQHPGFYVPNHFAAWYADRNQDFETAKEHHAENRAAKIKSADTLGSIMGGVEDQMRKRDAQARRRK